MQQCPLHSKCGCHEHYPLVPALLQPRLPVAAVPLLRLLRWAEICQHKHIERATWVRAIAEKKSLCICCYCLLYSWNLCAPGINHCKTQQSVRESDLIYAEHSRAGDAVGAIKGSSAFTARASSTKPGACPTLVRFPPSDTISSASPSLCTCASANALRVHPPWASPTTAWVGTGSRNEELKRASSWNNLPPLAPPPPPTLLPSTRHHPHVRPIPPPPHTAHGRLLAAPPPPSPSSCTPPKTSSTASPRALNPTMPPPRLRAPNMLPTQTTFDKCGQSAR